MNKMKMNNKKNKLLFLFVGIAIMSLLLVPAMAVPTTRVEKVNLTREDSKTSAFNKLEFGPREFFEEGDSLVSVIVETTTNDYEMFANLVESFGGIVTIEYNNIDGVSINIPASAILALAESPLVGRMFKDDLRELNVLKEYTDTHVLMTDANVAAAPIALDVSEEYPSTYTNSYLTDADLIWTDTNFGEGATVAIIDTGCWDEPWVDPDGGVHEPWYSYDTVYDGIDLSYDAGDPVYGGYGNPMNHYHGTGCAALIAASVELTFYPSPDPPYSPHRWGLAIANNDPSGGTSFDPSSNETTVLCTGIAPGADIFAVKVFDHTGAGVPSSIIMQGVDAAITEGVDVISMSLGGGVGAPGVDPSDLLIDAATEAGITVVVSAGNEGPAPLKVGSPGTAKTAITVGAAQDPFHERMYGDIAYGPSVGYGWYYYPHDEYFIADFSSRGPTSDGRNKPDVVATGSWTFFGLTPAHFPYTITLAGGTSFSCPQVAGEAVLLTAYIKNNGLDLGPSDIKKAIMEGAIPLEGYEGFEQGSGYINCYNSLELIKEMAAEDDDSCCHRCRCRWNRHFGSWWFPPLDMLYFDDGVATVNDITLEVGMFEYFNFWVNEEVDSIKITLSDITYDDFNPAFGDAGVLYLSTAAREGIDDYYFYLEWIWADEHVFQISSDVHVQPGVARLVLAGDFSAFGNVHIGEMTIEVVKTQAFKWGKKLLIMNSGVDVEEAQVSLYDGEYIKEKDKVKEGESDVYYFTIPDTGEAQLAIVELSWFRDWSKWATSDLDIIIYQIFADGSYNVIVDGATGASPEIVQLTDPADYIIIVEGYQVYFDKNEYYSLEIIYFTSLLPIWDSKIFALDRWIKCIRLPRKKKGLAVLWLYYSYFDYW